MSTPKRGDPRRSWTNADYGWFCECAVPQRTNLGDCARCFRLVAS